MLNLKALVGMTVVAHYTALNVIVAWDGAGRLVSVCDQTGNIVAEYRMPGTSVDLRDAKREAHRWMWQ